MRIALIFCCWILEQWSLVLVQTATVSSTKFTRNTISTFLLLSVRSPYIEYMCTFFIPVFRTRRNLKFGADFCFRLILEMLSQGFNTVSVFLGQATKSSSNTDRGVHINTSAFEASFGQYYSLASLMVYFSSLYFWCVKSTLRWSRGFTLIFLGWIFRDWGRARFSAFTKSLWNF